MLGGKPAGVRCPNLSHDNRCELFDCSERPAVCSNFSPSTELCGESNEEALQRLTQLELATR